MAQKKTKKPAKAAKEAGLTEQLLLLEKKNLKTATKRLRKNIDKQQRELGSAVKSACERLTTENNTEGCELIAIIDPCGEPVILGVQNWNSFDTAQGFYDGRYAAIISTDLALVPELLTLAVRVASGDHEEWMTISAKELIGSYYRGQLAREGMGIEDFLLEVAEEGDPKEAVDRLSVCVYAFTLEDAIAWVNSLGLNSDWTDPRTEGGMMNY